MPASIRINEWMMAYMGWLRLVGSLKTYVFFAKEPYKRDDNLQKRLIILRSLLIIANPGYMRMRCHMRARAGLYVCRKSGVVVGLGGQSGWCTRICVCMCVCARACVCVCV